jgi:cell division protein ZapE
VHERLAGRLPQLAPERLVAALVPPPRFAGARFSTYVPDPAEPSQAAAVAAGESFAAGIGADRRSWFRRRQPETARGLYLDGGFGVGKTHLLAAIWHASPGPKAYGTFVEITHLVGALGFAGVVAALAGHRLLCVDEFELDDPGDTVLVSSLLAKLTGHGVRITATSNTLPGRLGEGRFAAQDFLREIQGLASAFQTIRVDGPDFRHRGPVSAPDPLPDDLVRRTGGGATLDQWNPLLEHLAAVHPSRYGGLLDGVTSVHLLGVEPVPDQAAALRVVVFADRLYDRNIPVLASGIPLDQLFSPAMLAGGYRKKYLRAISRLTALARAGAG